MPSLRAKLLVASPVLTDFFHRSAVLVIEHSEEEGAMGVVLNRSSEAEVEEVVPVLAGLVGEGELVRIGGPVAQNSVVALGDFDDPDAAGRPILGPLGVLDPDGDAAGLRRLRVYAGYAGWAPGQLESELAQDAWIVVEADPDDPFRDDDLWSVALERRGGEYALLARMPADPSLN